MHAHFIPTPDKEDATRARQAEAPAFGARAQAKRRAKEAERRAKEQAEFLSKARKVEIVDEDKESLYSDGNSDGSFDVPDPSNKDIPSKPKRSNQRSNKCSNQCIKRGAGR